MAWPALRGLDSRGPALPEFFESGNISSQLDVLLFEREASHRARAGSDADIWFASTGENAFGRRARAAAAEALGRLTGRQGYPSPLAAWFNSLRSRIAASAGAPEASVLLAPSDDDARGLARFVAATIFGRAPVEIMAPVEELGARARADAKILPLRDSDGAPLPADLIDAMAERHARAALEAGASVLLHALDVSSTGLSGASLDWSRALMARADGRAMAVFDASQFRARPGDIAQALRSGIMAIVSGSRFVGGPTHCSALILPAGVAQSLAAAAPRFDPDIAPARLDAPAEFRHAMGDIFDAPMNVGLGLRWTAALTEFDRYRATPRGMREMILDDFGRRARAMAARREVVDVEPRPLDEDEPCRASLIALFPRDPRGGRASFLAASAIHTGLALPRPQSAGDAICHIGAPVRAGQSAILTISASAAMVADVFERLERGISYERAIGPVWRDLATVFDKWEALAG